MNSMENRAIVTEFVKARASQGINQECVEVAWTADGGRAVQDSKDRDGGTQFYGPGAWAAFVCAVKAGFFGP
ncbi:protein of unknown function [Streptomyces sp. 2323.1]|nr:protein of unknown function [Streptomyces sp. 2314.4]SOE12987.1 protein of unknown function [Streptomyces sp. 2323.1]